MVICLERCADLHMAQLMPLPLKSRLVFPLWYWLARVVPDKGLLNGCVCLLLTHPLCTKHRQGGPTARSRDGVLLIEVFY